MNFEQYFYYTLYALIYPVLATVMKYILNIRTEKDLNNHMWEVFNL